MTDNEKLIEEARILSDRVWREHWPRRAQRALRALGDALEAAEKAHAPTADEREALWKALRHELVEQDVSNPVWLDRSANGLVAAAFAAGFRRSEVPEPSAGPAPIPPCSCPCHTTPGYSHIAACCTVEPQGEPSDARWIEDIETMALAQATGHARMIEIGEGIGGLGLRNRAMFEDMLAWQDATEDGHADTVLRLVAALRAAGSVTEQE